MNRRDCLKGLFALAGVAATPAAVELALVKAATYTDAEVTEAMFKIYSELWQDFVLYGDCFAEQLTEFPFIRRIPPDVWAKEIYVPRQ